MFRATLSSKEGGKKKNVIGLVLYSSTYVPIEKSVLERKKKRGKKRGRRRGRGEEEEGGDTVLFWPQI
jgi:hypothetical protein